MSKIKEALYEENRMKKEEMFADEPESKGVDEEDDGYEKQDMRYEDALFNSRQQD